MNCHNPSHSLNSSYIFFSLSSRLSVVGTPGLWVCLVLTSFLCDSRHITAAQGATDSLPGSPTFSPGQSPRGSTHQPRAHLAVLATSVAEWTDFHACCTWTNRTATLQLQGQYCSAGSSYRLQPGPSHSSLPSQLSVCKTPKMPLTSRTDFREVLTIWNYH